MNGGWSHWDSGRAHLFSGALSYAQSLPELSYGNQNTMKMLEH